MPHKNVTHKAIVEKENQISGLQEAIDRLRIYGQARNDRTVKKLLDEVRINCKRAMKNKDDALSTGTDAGAREAMLWLGHEKAFKFILTAVENADDEIKEYRARIKQHESELAGLRKKRGVSAE